MINKKTEQLNKELYDIVTDRCIKDIFRVIEIEAIIHREIEKALNNQTNILNKETEQKKKEFEKEFPYLVMLWENKEKKVWDWIEKALNNQTNTLKKKIEEIPRIEITLKDGSKTKAILEHSLKTHGLIK